MSSTAGLGMSGVTSGWFSAFAAYAAVCVAVIATVMASRDVTAWHGHPKPATSGRGEPDRLVRRCRGRCQDR